MNKKIFKLFLFSSILFVSNNNYSQSKLFLNPGLKFGYAFGEKGGFIFGAELSFVYWHSDSFPFYYGAVISVERGRNITIYHFGIETGMAFGGVEIGPSFIRRNGNENFGYGLTAYTGFILMPFYNYTKIKDGEHISEVGSFIKIPVLIKGSFYYNN